MLKGQVTIELKDVKTGKVKSIDGGNMITTALSDFSKLMAGSYINTSQDNTRQYILPVATNALGGLIIFESPLSQNAEDYQFKTSNNNKVIAMAGNDSDATNPNRGSYNGTESGPTETGFRSVWDFGTSQANGQISALARTNIYFTNDPRACLLYGAPLALSPSKSMFPLPTGYQAIPFKYDELTQEVYGVGFNTTGTQAVYEVQIYKRRMPKFSYKVNEDYESFGDAEAVGQPYTLNLSSYAGSLWMQPVGSGDQNRTNCSIDEDAGYFYMAFTTDISSASACVILRIKLSTLEIDTISVPTSFRAYYATISGGYAFIQENYSSRLHIINIADPTDETIITGTNNTWMPGISVGSGAILYGDSQNSVTLSILYADGTKKAFQPSNATGSSSWGIGTGRSLAFHKLLRSGYQSYSNSPVLVSNMTYLGTKYNLPTPVTKTAAQTMKVIYTLTDA